MDKEQEKKVYCLDLTLAIEARNSEEAMKVLTSDIILDQIKEAIIAQKGDLKEIIDKQNPEIIN